MRTGAVCLLQASEDKLLQYPRITHTLDRSIRLDAVSPVLITDGSAINAIGRIRKGGAVSTFQRRISIDLIQCYTPLLFVEIINRFSGTRQERILDALNTTSKVDPTTWDCLKQVLDLLQPSMLDQINYIDSTIRSSLPLSRDPRFAMALFEKEAVGLALTLAKMDRHQLDEWVAPSDPAPFLMGLDSISLSEDQIVQHDLGVFGKWTNAASNAFMTQFTTGTKNLTVLNVNRTPIEQTLGVDLIYYQHEFRSFVLIQYKKFTKERRRVGASTKSIWTYRPSSDHNFNSELERMRLVTQFASGAKGDPTDYRLNAGPCYLKICQPEMDFYSKDLAHGMYLSLEYLDVLLESSSASGPRGGKVISHETVNRYLNNTDFVGLVQNGWIGSVGDASNRIADYIRAGLQDRRSFILASVR